MVSRKALLSVPNTAIVASLSQGGVRSMTSEPTARTGLLAGARRSATTSADARVAAAATRPTTALHRRGPLDRGIDARAPGGAVVPVLVMLAASLQGRRRGEVTVVVGTPSRGAALCTG